MKLKLPATILLLALGAAAARAQTAPQLSLPGQPAPAPKFTDAQLLEALGWYIGTRAGVSQLEFSAEEVASVLKGFSTAASGKDSPVDMEKVSPQLSEFMKKKEDAITAKMKSKNDAVSADHFKKLKENKAIIATPSGLHYEITKQGTGDAPKAADTVKVHYTGKLLDGKVFDSSVQRGEPVEFQLDQVIPGWTEGLQKVTKGGKITLHIPAQLGYGDRGNESIPPGSTLVFDVELLDIKSATMPAKK